MVFATAQFSFSQDFQRSYGSLKYEDARTVQSTDDGCFVIAGLDKGGDDAEGDAYMMKVNAAGAVLWKNYYGLELEDGINKMIPTNDGGFLLIGHVDLNAGICDGYIIKTDKEGTKEWSLIIGEELDDLCFDGLQTAAGDFYFTGCYENPTTQNMDMMFSKVSAEGELIFLKAIDNGEHEIGTCIKETNDGGFLVSGWNVNDQAEEDFHFANVDANGNTIWQKSYGTETNDRILDLQILEDGSFLTVGGSHDGLDIEHAMVGTLSMSGGFEFSSLESSKENGYIHDITTLSNGNFVLCGQLKVDGGEDGDMFMMTIDENRQIVDKHIIPFEGDSRANAILPISDDEFIIAGKTALTSSNMDILLTRLNTSNSASITSNSHSTTACFPNPFNDFTYLQIPTVQGEKEVQIYSLDGQLKWSEKFSENEVFIPRNDLSKGTYIYHVKGEDGSSIANGKLTAL